MRLLPPPFTLPCDLSCCQVSACKSSDNWTCITFSPDLAKFDMLDLEVRADGQLAGS
jgi:hypothetical protein